MRKAQHTLTQRKPHKIETGLKNYLLRLTVGAVWCMYFDTARSQIRSQSKFSSMRMSD